ncbi:MULTISPECIES: DUF4231 domain-containing protein [unclassified Streptomyces]|uniref:DUF4231 domain-containing protein n=1 Tax=unclassified Streptomyces TaxID=2593676 RepID=UPI002E0E3E5F|nr:MULTISPECIES: DUF4231 domain-containing protein [unclassified Streptomyces]WSR28156.1 DUF4231 domain-containing protein [Streptomyces sp. NBC_01205]
MTTPSTILTIDQSIIAKEAEVVERRLIRRFTLLWMLAVNPLLIGALIAANVLVDWPSGPENHDRSLLNFLGGSATIVSILGSAYWWTHFRRTISAVEVELRQLEAEKRHLQSREVDTAALPGVFPEYYESISTLRDDYRRSAEKYRSRHNLFQLTVIVGSILTSVATTASAEQGVWSWVAVAISALVSISAGIIAYFKFRERSLNLQQTADSVDLELQAYALRIRRYRDLSGAQASTLFAEEIERIREEQRKKELQLEQPPEGAQQQQRPQLT